MKNLELFFVLLFLISLNKYICIVKDFCLEGIFKAALTLQKDVFYSNRIFKNFLHKLGLVGAAAAISRVAAFLFLLIPLLQTI